MNKGVEDLSSIVKKGDTSLLERMVNSAKRYIAPIVAGSLFTLYSSFSALGDITISWEPNSDSDLAGYKVYKGTSSGIYDDLVDVGNLTSYILTNLVNNQTYYIAVTAYDTTGNESLYSNEAIAQNHLNTISVIFGPTQIFNNSSFENADGTPNTDPAATKTIIEIDGEEYVDVGVPAIDVSLTYPINFKAAADWTNPVIIIDIENNDYMDKQYYKVKLEDPSGNIAEYETLSANNVFDGPNSLLVFPDYPSVAPATNHNRRDVANLLIYNNDLHQTLKQFYFTDAGYAITGNMSAVANVSNVNNMNDFDKQIGDPDFQNSIDAKAIGAYRYKRYAKAQATFSTIDMNNIGEIFAVLPLTSKQYSKLADGLAMNLNLDGVNYPINKTDIVEGYNILRIPTSSTGSPVTAELTIYTRDRLSRRGSFNLGKFYFGAIKK